MNYSTIEINPIRLKLVFHAWSNKVPTQRHSRYCWGSENQGRPERRRLGSCLPSVATYQRLEKVTSLRLLLRT
jgi:hypothetical protein